MKLRLRSACLVAALAVVTGAFSTGCSVMDTVRNQFSEFHETAVVPAEEKVTYATAQTVLTAMGYAYERGSQAGHRLEMATAVQPGSSAQNLRQRRVILEFRAMGSEGTDVSVGFWEMSEETGQKTTAVAGGRLIRGGALYEAFWDRIGKALPAEPGAGPAAPAEPPASTP